MNKSVGVPSQGMPWVHWITVTFGFLLVAVPWWLGLLWLVGALR